ncbi:MAG TPA: methylmalonyl-CoA mutase family protein [Thermoanaerobaculia bacterium]|jgi:methylmalonyl-CoA mutase
MPGSSGLFATDFPPISYDEWRRRVEDELGGAPFELPRVPFELPRRPLYAPQDLERDDPAGLPGLPPFVRGSHELSRGWITAQEYRPDEDPRTLEADVAAGVRMVVLPALGACPERFLPYVDLGRIAVVLSSGASVAAAGALVAEAARQGVAARELEGGFGCDPLAALASAGGLPGSLDRAWSLAADLTAWSVRETPRMRALTVDLSPYHAAGAGAAQELAFAAAGGVEHLRRLTAAGLAVDAVADATLFAFSVAGDVFMEIAKLRAARLLWAKVVGASGGSPAAGKMRLHARTSTLTRTVRDPWVNLLRGTVESFAAAVGGADAIATAPFDELLGPPGRTSRRIAVNTQHILREEVFLAEVLDPAGGSYCVEKLTDELARAAWTLFQEVERRGGMARALADGWIAERVAATARRRREAAARRTPPIVGVSDFVYLGEELPRQPAATPLVEAPLRPTPTDALRELERVASTSSRDGSVTAAAVAAAAAGASADELAAVLWRGSQPARAAALPAVRLAEPYEELRARSGRWRDARRRRPRIFLAQLGEPSQYRDRAGFATSLFAAGGIEAVDAGGFAADDPASAAEAFAASGAELAALCSTDELYPEAVPRLAAALKERGARAVILAGRPGGREASYRAAGVDQFIYLGGDAVAVLRAVWDVLDTGR